jgi:hypothetical protein
MHRLREPRWHLNSLLFCALLIVLVAVLPLFAKTAVDFDPSLDFSKYKTFAFLGGVENLLMVDVNPDLLNNRVHHSVARELIKKGLREVRPGENPGLVVRYWANPSQQVNVAALGKWAPYSPFIGSHWSWLYDSVSASSAKQDSLIVDLIDPKTKNLAWRLYLIHKLTNADKDWNKADDELARAFESFPPSAREKDEKQKERAAHAPKTDQP